MSDEKPERPVGDVAGERPSKCASESRRAEMERIWAMTPRERMIEALELGQWLPLLEKAKGSKERQEP